MSKAKSQTPKRIASKAKGKIVSKTRGKTLKSSVSKAKGRTLNRRVSKAQGKITKRMRTEVKYSALVNMSMRLLKANKLYKLFKTKEIAKIQQIKSYRNFSIIVLMLASLFAELSVKFTKKKISTYIFKYMRGQLQLILRNKYQKRERQNSEIFIQTALRLNLKNIKVLQRAFAVNVRNRAKIGRIVQGLYDRNKCGNFEREQVKSMNKLVKLICTYSVKPSSETQINMINDIEDKKQKTHIEMVSTGLEQNKSIQGSVEDNQIRIPLENDIFFDEFFANNQKHNGIDWFNDI